MSELGPIMAIAQRDLMKLLRDRPRLITTLAFPLLLIGVLGGSLQANLGRNVGFNFLAFTFTGVFGQTLFQTTAQGIMSLIGDREMDFSQEMFVSPISRYSIIVGKILGESLVALPQAAAILAFAFVVGIRASAAQIGGLVVAGLLICLLGGAFGVLVLSNLSSQQMAGQIFTFVMLPQFFLAGIFNPIKVLPPYLDILSRIAPMRYAVDLARGAFYAGHPEFSKTVLDSPIVDLAVMAAMFAVFLVVGTALFVRNERNR
ncbi:MAG TPA: ABC transporter permease [Candidatus Acidoferrum sp.]|nr:ABC transporter permease [Candidatus Acidoferrum sp.]